MDLMLDTNIILDHIGRREPFYELSRRVCLLGVVQEASTYISVNMLTDIYYLLRGTHGSDAAQEMIEHNLSFLPDRRGYRRRMQRAPRFVLGGFRGLPCRPMRRENQSGHRHAQRQRTSKRLLSKPSPPKSCSPVCASRAWTTKKWSGSAFEKKPRAVGEPAMPRFGARWSRGREDGPSAFWESRGRRA